MERENIDLLIKYFGIKNVGFVSPLFSDENYVIHFTILHPDFVNVCLRNMTNDLNYTILVPYHILEWRDIDWLTMKINPEKTLDILLRYYNGMNSMRWFNRGKQEEFNRFYKDYKDHPWPKNLMDIVSKYLSKMLYTTEEDKRYKYNKIKLEIIKREANG